MATTDPWAMSMEDLKRAAFSPGPQGQRIPELDSAFSQFQQQCPDFQNTAENVDALLGYIVNPLVATADDLRQAHALATYQQKYQAPSQSADPWSMPMADLQKAAGVDDYAIRTPDIAKLPSHPDQSDTARQLLESEANSSERAVRQIQFLKETMPHVSR